MPTTEPTTEPTTAPVPVTNSEKVQNAVQELDKVKEETKPEVILETVKQIFNDLKETVTGTGSEKKEKLAETVVKSLDSLKELEDKLIENNGRKVAVDATAVEPTVEIRNTEFNVSSGQEGRIVVEEDSSRTKPADLNVDSVKVFSFSMLIRQTSGSEWVKQPSKEFDVPMYVTIDVPKEIDTSNGITIYHIADGSDVWEEQGDGILSQDGSKVSFVAGSFSSYAIAAKAKAGTVLPTSSPDDEDDGDEADTVTGEQKAQSPKTGDYMNHAADMCVIILIMAGIGMAAVVKRRRESE